MVRFKNFIDTNENLRVVEKKGAFIVVEHAKDLNIAPDEVVVKYFLRKMNCTQRQVAIRLNSNAVRLAPGAMQFMTGSITSGKGVIGSAFNSSDAGCIAVKPVYQGTGTIVCESSYKHILLEDAMDWDGALVCDDSRFIACDAGLRDTLIAHTQGTIKGSENCFNLHLAGTGIVALSCPCPREELYELQLENDTVKIDGNTAICWSKSLNFHTEQASKLSGEGLINVFEGTGRILMTPLK